jgi:hypothetical protein
MVHQLLIKLTMWPCIKCTAATAKGVISTQQQQSAGQQQQLSSHAEGPISPASSSAVVIIAMAREEELKVPTKALACSAGACAYFDSLMLVLPAGRCH